MSGWTDADLAREQKVRELRQRRAELERALGDVVLELRRLAPEPLRPAVIVAAPARVAMPVFYVDGGCSGNGQLDVKARTMVAVVTAADGTVLSEQEHLDGGSNNIAELLAVRDAVAHAAATGVTAVEIRTDSRNNFSWVLGRKVGRDINDRTRVLELKAEIDALRARVQLKLVWVPREHNVAGHYIERKYCL